MLEYKQALDDLRDYAKMIERLTAENERLRAVMAPFSDMAGELFMRNWNNKDVVIALDNPDDPHRLTAGDFFAIREALHRRPTP